LINLDELAKKGSAEREVLNRIDLTHLPKHIAVIMDGNGRWARMRNLPRVEGHRAGIQSVGETVEMCGRLGIKILTLYAFSVENWKRPKTEISTLMKLLREYLRKELRTLKRNNIRLNILGRMQEMPESIQKDLSQALSETSQNTGLLLNIALNYGGRTEILDAVTALLAAQKSSHTVGSAIDEETFSGYLYTAGMPDPDLLIRTSGEMRISNFLLWQIAYSEIWITPTLWPDFRRMQLFQAIADFQQRERRYGGIVPAGVAREKS
jgi:undecaprenyl diphosphate synthase